MSPIRGTLNFGLTDEPPGARRRRWAAFGISCALQPLAVAVAAWTLATPLGEIHPKHRNYLYLQVALPPAPEPRLSIPSQRWRAPRLEAPPVPELQRPEAPPPVMAVAVPAPPKLPSSDPSAQPAHLPPPELSAAPRPEAPAVRTDVFGGSPVATVSRAPREVQTGGFGNVNGLPGEAQGDSRGNVARLGSFDLPVGPGVGNGYGGSRGVRGRVISAGFGEGTAGAGGTGAASRGAVGLGGFGDMNSSPQVTEKRLRAAPAPELEPVEILAKPNPSYTEEARRLRVEGEVLLDVVFSASGELRVLGVLRGLGHGLDEAARRAAEQIRFKPARHEGQPIDSRATLHIVFQLAY